MKNHCRKAVIAIGSLLSLYILASLMSCNGGSSYANNDDLKRLNDSLLMASNRNEMKVQEMNNYFDSIASCLDSIAIYEDMLVPVVNPETRQRYTKAEIRQRLTQLGELIANQKARIASLSEALSKSNDSVKSSGIVTTIEHLRAQLGEKEQRINNLVRELEGKNKDIRRLSSSVTALESELSSSKAQNEMLASAVVAQTEAMNEGYVLIGTKKRLQELGILSKGGLFKKSKYQPDNINTSMCQKVDISVVRSLPLSSKNPKILTAAPSGSYHIATNGETSVLHIDNPNQFWSISSVLIVQL